MEKDTPTYDLEEIKRLVRRGGRFLRITDSSRVGAEALRFQDVEAQIIEVILNLSPDDFDKSAESELRPGLWLDVYWPVVNRRRLYVKLQVVTRGDSSTAVVVSFKRNLRG